MDNAPNPFESGDAPDDATLERYLMGESPPDELAMVTAWTERDRKVALVLTALRSRLEYPWLGHDTEPVRTSRTRREETIRQAIAEVGALRREDLSRNGPPGGQSGLPLTGDRRGVFGTNAVFLRRVVAGVIGAGFVAVAAIAIQGRGTPEPASPPTRYTTDYGDRAKIDLADGTRVLLNVGSRIEVPADFNKKERVVRLIGQAYFEVPSSSTMPFTVQAGDTRAVVLGTAFGVRAYPSTDVEVAVQTGRVGVGTTVLGARDVARVSYDGQVTLARNQNLDDVLGFVSGRLTLGRVPVRDAIVALERWYDVQIQLADPAIGDLMIGGIYYEGSPTDLATLLQLTLGVRVERDGRRLTLHSRS